MSEQAVPLEPRLVHEHAAPLLVGPRSATRSRRARTDGSWSAARLTSDVACLVLASALAGRVAPPAAAAGWTALITALTVLGFAGAGLYLPRLKLQLTDELWRVCGLTAIAALAGSALTTWTTGVSGAGDTALVLWLVAGGSISASRLALYGAQRAARRHPGAGRRTLIIGAGEVGRLTAHRLLTNPQLGLSPIGFLDKEPLATPSTAQRFGGDELPILGASWDLERIVQDSGIDHVVVAFSTAPHHVMLDLVRRCWKLGLSVFVVPRLFEVEGQRMRVEHLGALPIVGLQSADPSGWRFSLKYSLDRVVAALLLIALAPIVLAVTAAVAIAMGRPVLFRQRRVGRDGQAFDILKFRTMKGSPELDGEADALWAALSLGGADAEVAPQIAADDRRTPLGAFLRRYSLDELPQLLNVIRGEMSLVGPRPERPHYVARFEDAIYRYPDRHRVKSGLTGWAQVHGLRGDTSLSDRIEWDNFYIENWTAWLDVKILLLTVPTVFRRRGSG